MNPQRSFGPMDLYERGMADADSLTPEERYVYIIMEIETLSELEGWDGFFLSPMVRFLPEAKQHMAAAGDRKSLAVLDDYESHLWAADISMEPEAIKAFLDAQDDEYRNARRDWRAAFDELVDSRWELARAYLLARGIELTY